MSLLMHCIPSAYQINPELFALICCKMVSLSIEHGNCPMSAKGYGSFAAILSGIVGNFQDGYRFGKLGVDLCEKLDDITVRSACHFTWAAFASHWTRPMDEGIQIFREGARWGLVSGDHPHAAYCAGVAITHVMIRGTPLAVARAQTDEALTLLARIADSTNYSLLRSRRRLADWLHTPSSEHTLDTPEFDETRTLQELQATSVSKSMLAHFQSLRVMHRYFDGQYSEAWRISRIVDGLLVYVPGMMTVVEHAFFQCLSAAAVWREVPALDRAGLEARFEAQLRNIGTWAKHCPENFTAMHLTVCAERARVLGETAKAGELYEQAVLAACAHRFLNVEAIACELAMRNCADDPARAASWRERAIIAYEAWGAMRKADALRAAR